MQHSRFACILADVPWEYRDKNTRGASSRHYPTLSLEDIMALPVAEIAADDAHLWFWTTNQMLVDGTAALVIQSWGFSPKTLVTWCKTTQDGKRPKFGVGHYLRNSTEHMIFAVRGKLAVLHKDVPTYFLAPVSKTHSRKPDQSYVLVERVSPGPRLELFATRTMPGWVAVGYGVTGRDIREDLAMLVNDPE